MSMLMDDGPSADFWVIDQAEHMLCEARKVGKSAANFLAREKSRWHELEHQPFEVRRKERSGEVRTPQAAAAKRAHYRGLMESVYGQGCWAKIQRG